MAWLREPASSMYHAGKVGLSKSGYWEWMGRDRYYYVHDEMGGSDRPWLLHVEYKEGPRRGVVFLGRFASRQEAMAEAEEHMAGRRRNREFGPHPVMGRWAFRRWIQVPHDSKGLVNSYGRTDPGFGFLVYRTEDSEYVISRPPEYLGEHVFARVPSLRHVLYAPYAVQVTRFSPHERDLDRIRHVEPLGAFDSPEEAMDAVERDDERRSGGRL